MTPPRWPHWGVVALAALGGVLLLVIAATFWQRPGDSLAYWIAAQNVFADISPYARGEAAFAPYAYHYPPPMAQALAPLTVFIPDQLYVAAYRAILLLSLWGLAGRRFLSMLALIAVLPVAVELRFENVNLLMAVGIVLGLQRWPWLFAVGAVVKISPGLGVLYLAAARRWRDALISAAVGLAIVALSFVIGADLWTDWLEAIAGQAEGTGNSLIPVPYLVRAAAGVVLAVAGGLVGRRTGQLLLVGAITIANPNLALNGFAVLAAAVPIWRAGPDGLGEPNAHRLP